MSLDLASLFSPGTILGAAVGFGISIVMDKVAAKRSGIPDSSFDGNAKIVELQAEIEANRDAQGKVLEVHAYARTLEEKIQQLESTSDSADSQLRVKVLEKQLSEKADLESKLAVALQQLEDYKAKADMFDTVVGAEPPTEPVSTKISELTANVVEAEPIQEAEPLAEVLAEEVASPIEPAAELEPVAEVELVAEVAPEVETVAAVATTAQPVAESEPENESIAAVALSEDAPPEMTVVENENTFSEYASPVGSTAPAIDGRPALRVESNSIVDVKDPLEKIEGIGQVYQTKLYEAGIRTFAQLAAASPSRITEIVEPQNWQTIDIMKWRREAALYAAGEKS